MNNKFTTILAILFVVLGGIYLISKNNADNKLENAAMEEKTKTMEEAKLEKDDTVMKEETIAPETAMMENEDVKEFKVGGGAFYFDPTEITVTEGDKVRIVFTNEGGTHDWVIDEFDARTSIIQTGETATIEFTADQAGTFEYYCSVGNHRAQGMVGTLTVEPKL